MKRTTLELKLYLHLLITIGAIFLIIAIFNLNLSQLNWPAIFFFGVLTFLFLIKPVKLSEEAIYYLDDIPCYAAIFLLGPKTTILMLSLSFLVYLLYNEIRIKPKKQNLTDIYLSLVNLSQIIISTGIAGLVYQLINRGDLLLSSPRNLIAVLSCILIKFTLNTLETSFNLFLKNYPPLDSKSRKTFGFLRNKYLTGFTEVWKKNFGEIWLHFLMLASLGVVLGILYQSKSWAIIIIALPILAFYLSFNVYHKIIQQSQRTFQALTRIIDARDHSTFGHSERVAVLAKAIAGEMKLGKKIIQLIEQAGKIHDLGKITISDNILKKKKPLTPQETDLMKTHSIITSDFFKNLKNLKKYIPAETASMHHERYDGKGYTLGLKGNKIPLVSRILAVADVFDAMTSDRTYRIKFSEKEALNYIKESSGTQFDPVVVEAFLRVYTNEIPRKIKKEWEKREFIYSKIQKAADIESKFT